MTKKGLFHCRIGRRASGVLGALALSSAVIFSAGAAAAPFDPTANPVQLHLPLIRPRVQPMTVTLLDDKPFNGAPPYQVPVTAPHSLFTRHAHLSGLPGGLQNQLDARRYDQRMIKKGTIYLPVPSQSARERALGSAIALAPGAHYRVYLDITGTETGVQYDRTMTVWAGNVPIFYGTTPEPTKNGITWHVHKDVTRYLPVLTGHQTFTVQLDSYVSASANVNGIPRITAKLEYYPVLGNGFGGQSDADQPWALRPPTDIVPLGKAPVDFFSSVDYIGQGRSMTQQVDLPNNIKRVYADLYAIGQSTDEFFWGNQPAYRAVEVSIDGKPAGIAWPFPFIYTGGVNPLLWRPLVAIDTLDIPALRIDLTPFAAELAGHHTISIKVADNQGYWRVGGSLFVYAGGRPTRGHIVSDTLNFDQTSDTSTQASPAGDGDSVYGETATHDFEVKGTVDRATATVDYHDIYSNDQYTHGNSVQWVHASQVSRTTSQIAEGGGFGSRPLVHRDIETYTLDAPNGYFTQGNQFALPVTIAQSREVKHEIDGGFGWHDFSDLLLERVQGQAIDTSGPISGATTGVLSYHNSLGRQFDEQIRTRNGQIVYQSQDGDPSQHSGPPIGIGHSHWPF